MDDEPSMGKLGSPSKIRLRPKGKESGELAFYILSSEPFASRKSFSALRKVYINIFM